eukprot:1531410-Alexandrium_andersonii.AAC.1
MERPSGSGLRLLRDAPRGALLRLRRAVLLQPGGRVPVHFRARARCGPALENFLSSHIDAGVSLYVAP